MSRLPISRAGLSGSELSSATYNEIEREVDAETFKELTVGEYVDVVFKDPKSLEQQMPFYSIKVVYIQLMRVLKTLGLSYTSSTYIISAIFTSASVLMIALFLLHFGVPVLWRLLRQRSQVTGRLPAIRRRMRSLASLRSCLSMRSSNEAKLLM